MYDKIYKEIFGKDFIQKRELFCFLDGKRSVWEVLIYNKIYFLLVEKDDILEFLEEKEIEKKEYAPHNEAELFHFRYGKCTTEKRVIANRLFLELCKRYATDFPYLYRDRV